VQKADMLIPIERMGGLSFPDRRIRDFRYDGKTLRFVSDGIFVDGTGLIEQQTHVECIGSATGLSRIFVNEEWVDVNPQQDGLNFIGEWSINQQHLRLAGFDAQSGKWREYQIPVSSVSVKTDADT
jgi:hypothetical protein